MHSNHNTNKNVEHNSSSLSIFNKINQGSRLVGHQLLLWVPGILDQRKGVGNVESRITNFTTQWRGPEILDQPDPLSWDIWERPIGFMQQ
jgi:hypothetical protein